MLYSCLRHGTVPLLKRFLKYFSRTIDWFIDRKGKLLPVNKDDFRWWELFRISLKKKKCVLGQFIISLITTGILSETIRILKQLFLISLGTQTTNNVYHEDSQCLLSNLLVLIDVLLSPKFFLLICFMNCKKSALSRSNIYGEIWH